MREERGIAVALGRWILLYGVIGCTYSILSYAVVCLPSESEALMLLVTRLLFRGPDVGVGLGD